MKFLKITCSITILFLIYSCADYKVQNTKVEKKLYSSKGFALIYNNNLYEDGVIRKKINNDEFVAMHSLLKKNTNIMITNPTNLKEITLKVEKKINYPKIFNIIISEKLADTLGLDYNNPYVEISEIKKNETFVAKEGTIFDEEKNVALKAPVEKIEIDNLSKEDSNKDKKKNKKNAKNFVLVIGDFYYEESAVNLRKELLSKTKFKDLSIKKIKQNQYRLYAGPFKNFNTLKATYISLNKIGFNDLDVIRE